MTKALLAILCAPLLAQTAPAALSFDRLMLDKLRDRLAAYERNVDGVVGVAVIDIAKGRTISHNGGAVLAQASVIKVPLLVALYRDAALGRLRLDAKVTLSLKDAVGGSGSLQEELKRGAMTLDVRELMLRMVRDSDNTATNALIALTSRERVNALMDTLGLRSTRLRRVMMDTAAAARGEENTSTPEEMARLAAMLYEGKPLGRRASDEILAMMKTVKAAVRDAVPEPVAVASKLGELTGVSTEVAIVFLPRRPYVLAVAAAGLPAGAVNPVKEVARLVHACFDTLDRSNEFGNRVR